MSGVGCNLENGMANKRLLVADENPTWVAARVARFLAADASPLPSVNITHLADQVTLTVGFFGTLGNAALGGA